MSWAKFAPIAHSPPAGQSSASTGKGNPWLAATLGEIVAALSRTDTFLGERYRRLVKRRGKKRAIVAVGNSVLTIIWHLLSDPEAHYHDLGPDYHHAKINRRRREHDLTRQLEHITGNASSSTHARASRLTHEHTGIRATPELPPAHTGPDFRVSRERPDDRWWSRPPAASRAAGADRRWSSSERQRAISRDHGPKGERQPPRTVGCR